MHPALVAQASVVHWQAPSKTWRDCVFPIFQIILTKLFTNSLNHLHSLGRILTFTIPRLFLYFYKESQRQVHSAGSDGCCAKSSIANWCALSLELMRREPSEAGTGVKLRGRVAKAGAAGEKQLVRVGRNPLTSPTRTNRSAHQFIEGTLAGRVELQNERAAPLTCCIHTKC